MNGKIDVPELEAVLEGAGVDRVKYYHHPGGKAATVCLAYGAGGSVYVGTAILHPKDQFCRKVGHAVSLRKVVRQLDVKHRRAK